MTEDKFIFSFFSSSRKENNDQEENNEPAVFNVAYILEIIVNTKIDPEKIYSYTDPTITAAQNMDLSLNRTLNVTFWKISQRAHNTYAFRKFPEGMDIMGEIMGLGVGVKYIIGVYEGKYQPGIKTHPFSGSGWNIDDKRVEEIASAVKEQLETAKMVLNGEQIELPKDEIDGIPLIFALCYLKVESSGFQAED